MKKTQNDFPRKITFFKAIILKKIYTLPAISKRFKSWMMMPSISLMNAPSLYHWISGSGLASAQHSTRNEKKNKFGVILDQVLAAHITGLPGIWCSVFTESPDVSDFFFTENWSKMPNWRFLGIFRSKSGNTVKICQPFSVWRKFGIFGTKINRF